jgi:hypothetical protein
MTLTGKTDMLGELYVPVKLFYHRYQTDYSKKEFEPSLSELQTNQFSNVTAEINVLIILL